MLSCFLLEYPTMTKLPVVDFSKADCWKPKTSSWLSVGKDVCLALEEHGCFVTPDKVSLELHNTIFDTLKDLFDFPVEVKAKNRYEGNAYFGHSSYTPVQECLGIMNAPNTEAIQKYTHLFWPNGNEKFSESAYSYAKVTYELDHVVTKMVFENYGVQKYHDDHIQSTFPIFQFAHYKEPKKVGSDVGLESHTDKNFNTILYQNHVCGLEINIKDDEWIMFDPPLPSWFLFVAGDLFKVWSNGRIKSCRHRVSMRGNDEARYSFGLFSLKLGVTHTLEEFVDEDHPIRYRPFDQLEYINSFNDNKGGLWNIKEYCGV